MLRVPPSILRQAVAPALIVLVLCAAIGVIVYVQGALKRVEEELPLRVMEEKRDMERVARNFYQLLAAIEAAQAHPTEGNVASISDHLNTVMGDLEALRERYTFDTLIGASALHAVMSPAVDDVQIWLAEGFGALEPTSPILLELVSTRVRETIDKVYDKTTEADRIAYEILGKQSHSLGQLRNRLFTLLAVVLAFAASVVWLVVRQQRTARDRAAAEEAQRRAQVRLHEALESTSEGFAFFDRAEQLVIANTRYREFFLATAHEVVTPGASFEGILRAAIASGTIELGGDTAEEWLAWRLRQFRQPTGPFAVKYVDGHWVQINERKTADGGTVVVYSDVTELKRRELELMHAKEEAEAANEAKSSFLANVSHELRTPLTSVLGFARIVQKRFQTVLRPHLDPSDGRVARAAAQIEKNLDIILMEGDRLTKLINDVLDLEKIEAGEMVWNIVPFDIAEAVRQAAAATESLYRQKGLPFEIEVEPGVAPVLGDRDRVLQVLINLISNAVKFTESGRIACRVEGYGRGRLAVTVIDSGMGVAPEDQQAIFEKFRQVGDTLTDKPSGTGLGLPICREIIQHLGGDITVESSPGQGSKFRFWLPTAPADAEMLNAT